MRAFVVLTKIRVLEVFRKPASAFWFFALPIIIFGVLAFVFQNGHPFEKRRVIVVGDHPRWNEILAPIDGVDRSREETLDRAYARLESADASAIIAGDDAAPEVIASTREQVFARGLASYFGSTTRITLRPAVPHGYLRFLYPGLCAQAVVLAGLFGMGYATAKYRQSLFLRKLGTTQLSRAEFVLAQMAARMLLVLVQIVMMLVIGAAVLDLRANASGYALCAIASVLGLFAFMGLGFLIAAVVKSESVIVDVINAVSVPIALLSEQFFSVESMPAPLRIFSGALPSTAVVRLFRHALLGGALDGASVSRDLVVLCVWTAVTFVLASRSFKFE